ncbi:phage tail protein, partial [Pantoea sp. F_14]
MVYVLSDAWVHGEMNYNPEEGTVEVEFHSENGDFQ